MVINGTVYVKGNIGIVLNTDFSGSSLIEYLAKSSDTGNMKLIRQWYSVSIVYDFFISEAERDAYYVTNPTFLVADMICYIKDLGKYQYTNSVWVTVTGEIIPVIDPDLFDILGEKYTAKFNNDLTTIDSKVATIKANMDDVKTVEELIFTATVDNTTNISFASLTGLNLFTADYELEFKGLIFDKTNYTVNVNQVSIDLTGWSLKIGQVVTLKYSTKS